MFVFGLSAKLWAKSEVDGALKPNQSRHKIKSYIGGFRLEFVSMYKPGYKSHDLL